jgi:hypothetical protein
VVRSRCPSLDNFSVGKLPALRGPAARSPCSYNKEYTSLVDFLDFSMSKPPGRTCARLSESDCAGNAPFHCSLAWRRTIGRMAPAVELSARTLASPVGSRALTAQFEPQRPALHGICARHGVLGAAVHTATAASGGGHS